MVNINGKEYVWQESTTITELLRKSGHCDSCFLVELNHEYIFKPDFNGTIVPDDSILVTIPIIAGG